MFLIAGLGNPGNEYEMTRHNIGFIALDYVAEKYNIKVKKLKFKGLYGEGNIANEKVILVKPSTYMNNSGECLREFVRFYKIPIQNVIVIYDEMALPCGTLRIRPTGSDAGHNGIKSVLFHLQSEEFVRFRLGIGHAEYNAVDYVLGRFTKPEIDVLEKTIMKLPEALECLFKDGMLKTQSKFNG